MPGHKGRTSLLGCEPLDITEIPGADVLYSADGIIAESENNASALFGTGHTFYSAEGSSLSIKAMLALAAYDGEVSNHAANERYKPLFIATRNVHKAFIHACALLDLDVDFIYSGANSHLCRCDVTAQDVDNAIKEAKIKPHGVYLTSPDYLGNMQEIRSIADICHKYGIPLLVDNAHGAYLAFLHESLHPIALGADMCCDSAHKTLPTLTGAAYLHISKDAPPSFLQSARSRLSLFASTSPSYLILQSLDLCNRYISEGYRTRLEKCVSAVNGIKSRLTEQGCILEGNEPLKLTIRCERRDSSVCPDEILRQNGLECEYCDGEYLVCMITPENTPDELKRLEKTLSSLPQYGKELSMTPVPTDFPALPILSRACSIREASLAPYRAVPTAEAVGRICASPTVSCPPAVPIVISGEIISEQAVEALRRYGINSINVVSENMYN
ncbi:MAG: aminotransferase class V-fold PLP-dependent enzyme [Clostridia bacterium]|nr:aminotransferase class V-fold PLP-dependent enzyme [Clostridia bacterium]